jgi:hypothetical protein
MALSGAPEPADAIRTKAEPPGNAALRTDQSLEMQNVRKALEALSPDQRKRFGENLMRWSDLSPEEKTALREREAIRKKYMEQEVAAALAASGLQLQGERRAEFVRRFGEERRKIEEQLRHEMAEKRRPMVRELIGRLKAEFSEQKR